MKVYEHSSYEEYKNENIKLNVQKLPTVNHLIDKYVPVGEYLRDKMGWVRFGICHGSRNGKEINVLQAMRSQLPSPQYKHQKKL